mmetsp:Transcript_51461/g.156396  ORF Transcript_51461/g.156396 Transcript_51461/m.156396 type:complete len:182 (-) Transcript_51461:188-733(-)
MAARNPTSTRCCWASCISYGLAFVLIGTAVSIVCVKATHGTLAFGAPRLDIEVDTHKNSLHFFAMKSDSCDKDFERIDISPDAGRKTSLCHSKANEVIDDGLFLEWVFKPVALVPEVPRPGKYRVSTENWLLGVADSFGSTKWGLLMVLAAMLLAGLMAFVLACILCSCGYCFLVRQESRR